MREKSCTAMLLQGAAAALAMPVIPAIRLVPRYRMTAHIARQLQLTRQQQQQAISCSCSPWVQHATLHIYHHGASSISV